MSERVMILERPKLTHYSREPLGPVQSASQHRRDSDKPMGLWVSVDDGGEGWADWCRDESFRLGHLANRYHIELAPSARILWLGSARAIDDFDQAFGCDYVWSLALRAIRWGAVAEEYQGIVIAPYCWERRLDRRCTWYYGWDCASGCIWDAAAIASTSLLGSEAAPATTVVARPAEVAGGRL